MSNGNFINSADFQEAQQTIKALREQLFSAKEKLIFVDADLTTAILQSSENSAYWFERAGNIQKEINEWLDKHPMRQMDQVIVSERDELRSQNRTLRERNAELRKRIRTLVDCANARAAIPENGAMEAK